MSGGGLWNAGQDVEASQKNLLGWSSSQDIFGDQDDGTQPIPPSSQELLILNTPNSTQNSSLNFIDPIDLDMSEGTLERYARNLSSQGQIEGDVDDRNEDFPTNTGSDEVSLLLPAYYSGPRGQIGFNQFQIPRKREREHDEQSQQEEFAVFTQTSYLPQPQGEGEDGANFSGGSGEVSSSQESNRELPETVTWPGPYSFGVMPEDHFVKKCCYSSILDKIFCVPLMPIKFTMSIDFSEPGVNVKNLSVKAQLVYKDASLIESPVERCVSCSDTERNTTSGTTEDVLMHVLRCTHKKAEYKQNVETHRFSVIAPMDKPQPGAATVSKNYELTCLSSCKTINRKDLCLVFTLLENRAQVGRRSFDIKICKCPMRDCRNEQNKHLGISPKGGTKQKRGSAGSKRATTEPDEMQLSDLEIAAKSRCISPNPCNSRRFQVKEEENGEIEDPEDSPNNSQEIRDLWVKADVKFKEVAATQKSPNPSLRQRGKACLRQLRNFVETTEDLIKSREIEAPRSGNRADGAQQTSPPLANAFQVMGSPDSGFHGGNPNNQRR